MVVKRYRCVLSVMFVALALVVAKPVFAITVQGSITTHTRWTKAMSPVILSGDVTVKAGVTLTVDPGVQVVAAAGDVLRTGADSSRVELNIEGALIAVGTSTERILFRGSSTSKGTWYGIRILSGGSGTLTYATVQYGRYCVDNYNVVALNNIQIDNCSTYGVYARAGTTTVNGGAIFRNNYGFYLSGGKTKIANATIYRNTTYGVYGNYSSRATTVEITRCTIAHNANYGVYAYRSSSSSGAFILKDSIVVRNAGTNYEVYSGRYGITCSNNLIWDVSGNTIYNRYSPSCATAVFYNPLFVNENADDYRIYDRSPARKAGPGGIDIGALPWTTHKTTTLHGKLLSDVVLPSGTHTLAGDLIVGRGVTLTLSPGAVILVHTVDDMSGGVDRSKAELVVEGRLVAKGTRSSSLVVFRSTSSSTGSNLWYGIRALAGSQVTLQNVSLTNARFGLELYGTATLNDVAISRTQYGLYVRAGVLNMANSKLFLNQYGASISGGKTKLSYSLIYRNTSYGVYASYSSRSTTVEIDHCTIAYNSSYGIYSYRSSSSSGAFLLKDSIIVRNARTSYEVYNGRYGITCTSNLIWDASGSTVYNRYSPSCNASVYYNPLFVKEGSDDYRLYDRSPARKSGTGASDLGALPWNKGKQVTTVLHGKLTTHTVLPAGTHKLMGDLIVGKGATLTLSKGAILESKSVDDMYGGLDRTRSEIVVEGKLVAWGESSAKPIQFKAEGTSTTTNRWYGLRVLAGGSLDMRYVVVRSGRYGVDTVGTTLLRDVAMAYNGSYGLYIHGGTTTYTRGQLYRNSSYGVYHTSGVSTLSFLQIYRNNSYGVYANISASNSTVLVDHCTIANNSSYGVYVYRRSSSVGVFTLQNSIIVNNARTSYEVYSSYYGPVCKNNLIWDTSGSTLYTRYSPACTALVRANPLFKKPTSDDYNILLNSPARKRATDGSDLGALPFQPALAKVQIKPALGEVQVGKTIQFTATGINTQGGVKTGLTFSWKLVGGGGTISPTGLFTAGTKAGTFFSTVEATADGIPGYASVKITPGAIIKVVVSPNPGKAPPLRTLQFSATGQDQYGNQAPNLKVKWKLVKGGGTISSTGLVTTQGRNGTFTNTVEAAYGSQKGYATLVVDSNFPVVTSVVVTPSQVSMKYKEQKSFVAVAKDQNGKSMSGLRFAWSAPSGGGTVVTTSSTAADFVAGTKAGSYSLVAQTAGFKGIARITITDPNAGVLGSIVVTPSLATLKVGQTQQFKAQGYDKNNKPMALQPIWSAGTGTIDRKGLFKAGAATGSYTVTAKSGSVSGSATVQIAAGNAPTTPTLLSPADKAVVKTNPPILTLKNSTDPDKDKLTYDFVVATDKQFTTIVAQGSAAETPNTTSWKVSPSLKEDTLFYWRARATDSVLRSGWSVVRTFHLNAVNNAPTAPVRSAPADAGQVTDARPTLVVKNATDPEGKPLVYTFEVATDASMTAIVVTSNRIKAGRRSTSWKISRSLKNKTTYYWRAWAIDDKGLAGTKMTTASFVTSLPNGPPSAPKPKKPADKESVSALTVSLEVENATDPDGDVLTYHFQISEDKTFKGQLDEQQGTTEGQKTTTWKPKALVRGKTYFWRVRANDGTVDGTWSKVFSFTVDAKSSNEADSESVGETSLEQRPAEQTQGSDREHSRDGGNTDTATVEKPTSDSHPEVVAKQDTLQDLDKAPGGCGCSSQTKDGVPVGLWILCFLGLLLLDLRRQRKSS